MKRRKLFDWVASPPGPLSFREGEPRRRAHEQTSGSPSLKKRGPGGEARRLLALLTLLLLAPAAARAQVYPRRAPDLDRLTQELFAEIQTDEVPYEDLYGTLLNYYQSPLNLNTATAEELRALPLLRERQVQALLRYRQDNGQLLSVYELQAVPEWDVRTIQRVAPFVTVEAASPNSARGNLWQRIRTEENNALILRYRRVAHCV